MRTTLEISATIETARKIPNKDVIAVFNLIRLVELKHFR